VVAIEAGTTLLLRTGPVHDPGRMHLFIVLTAPKSIDSAEPGLLCVPMVSLSSIPKDRSYDTTCVLRAGDHPFIRHDTYVAYGLAIHPPLSTLQEKILRGECEIAEPLAPAVLERVYKGVFASKHVKPRFRGVCR
jgi:hypothetical protein